MRTPTTHPAAQIILDARKRGAYVAFHRQEIVFLCQYPELSDSEKVLWLWIAMQSAKYPQLGIYLSQKHAAQRLHRARGTINEALGKLLKAGFFFAFSQHRQCNHYYTQLPEAGMQALRADALLRMPEREIQSVEEVKART